MQLHDRRDILLRRQLNMNNRHSSRPRNSNDGRVCVAILCAAVHRAADAALARLLGRSAAGVTSWHSARQWARDVPASGTSSYVVRAVCLAVRDVAARAGDQ